MWCKFGNVTPLRPAPTKPLNSSEWKVLKPYKLFLFRSAAAARSDESPITLLLRAASLILSRSLFSLALALALALAFALSRSRFLSLSLALSLYLLRASASKFWSLSGRDGTPCQSRSFQARQAAWLVPVVTRHKREWGASRGSGGRRQCGDMNEGSVVKAVLNEVRILEFDESVPLYFVWFGS